MYEDRRKEPRCAIDVPLFSSLLTPLGNNIVCIINDISLNGAMVIIPPDDQRLLPEGQSVTFVEVPEHLEATLNNMHATVAWRKGKMCGLQFQNALPLTEDGLIAIVTTIENSMKMDLNLYDEETIRADFKDDEKF